MAIRGASVPLQSSTLSGRCAKIQLPRADGLSSTVSPTAEPTKRRVFEELLTFTRITTLVTSSGRRTRQARRPWSSGATLALGKSATALYLLHPRSFSSPISLEDIATMNRKRHKERSGGLKTADDSLHGPLELEAISAVHELAYSVQSISVSEILPRTADLIFVNVKTVEGDAPILACLNDNFRSSVYARINHERLAHRLYPHRLHERRLHAGRTSLFRALTRCNRGMPAFRHATQVDFLRSVCYAVCHNT